ncbi:hypothetical protein [Streptomyces sp. NPDC002825]|uniref:hypothetical protein n=1 Tax=Streptomyces sp. NPDC002825 TaxID=3154666 RepID=UPI00332D33E7
MRMLLRVEMDTKASNEAIRQGSLLKIIEGTLDELNAEAAYFTVEDGCRTAYIFFELTEPSQMPKISEPFFMEVGAKIHYSPVMNPEELHKGIAAITRS